MNRKSTLSLSLALTSLVVIPATAVVANRAEAGIAGANTPIVIAHRGASGHRPEHTLAAYRYALLAGADFIEPDVVVTRDGVLITRHENVLAEVQLDENAEISRDARGRPVVLQATTNVHTHAAFAGRLTTKKIDGRLVGGWFSEDFTLAEIRLLRARERLPGLRPWNRLHDDLYGIPTLAEVIELVRGFEARTGQATGLYIEIKHPTFFLHEGRHVEGGSLNVDLGGLLLATLQANGFVDPDRVYIQSFEMASLLSLRESLREQNLAFPLIQLFGDVFNLFYIAQPYDLVYHSANATDLYQVYGELATHLPDGINATIEYAHLATPAVLGFMARTYASGIGVAKHNVLPVRVVQAVDVDGDGRALQRTQLEGTVGPILADAHDAGLLLHAYTLRAEEPFLFFQPRYWIVCSSRCPPVISVPSRPR